MRKFLFLTAILCVAAFSAAAQKTTDFSGTWTLDVSKSKLDERARIESMTMTVTQTDKDIKIESATKRLPPPADASGGGRGGMGQGRGGFGGGDGVFTYTLDGKESQISQEGPMGAIPVTLKGKFEESKLKLSQSRTFSTQMGEITMTTKDTWTLSDDGKTLTVNRESESPRGTNSSEMVFTKKP
ncbi:MAG: hypothetical protein IPN69_07135 [Acidobacteria bacterium]|nr:hypothetical protein [Acidobacteriota bacterium]MBK8147316.1 hypothetical protein [Acidobacteriota bacterium]MBK8810497.1 hypothetical protein [Acidobacteriota bacterium]